MVISAMVGWDGSHTYGQRPQGIHPLASVGGPPESRNWMVGDITHQPEIAASALIHAFCTVDAGTLRPTKIGERSFLQARVHLGHDVVVGDDVELCAGVVVCGFVEIGDGARVSGNAWIKPRVKIGAGAIIGGGSVVTKDVPPHEVWAGNPARFMKVADTHAAWERAFADYYVENWAAPRDTELEQRQRAAMWMRETGYPPTAEILEHLDAA